VLLWIRTTGHPVPTPSLLERPQHRAMSNRLASLEERLPCERCEPPGSLIRAGIPSTE